MRIFRENGHFPKVLIVLRARVQALIVQETIRKMTGSLEVKLYFFPIYIYIYIYIYKRVPQKFAYDFCV
jgi:hypothetical protein